MKTPEQIARDILSPTIADDGISAPVNHSLIYRWVERAIEADREHQRQSQHYDDHPLRANGGYAECECGGWSLFYGFAPLSAVESIHHQHVIAQGASREE